MRGEIDQISVIVVKNSNNRRRSSMSMMQPDNIKTGRKSIVLENSIDGTLNVREGK